MADTIFKTKNGPVRALDQDKTVRVTRLHLDIWLPSDRTGPLPVLAFLHGGAFMTGGGGMSCYDGSALAAREGLVVVNVSYRLGALGFLPIKGVAPANLGLRDQELALRFIRACISDFGGDADNITVCGQSARRPARARRRSFPRRPWHPRP